MVNIKTSNVQMDDGVRLNVKVLGEDSNANKPLLIVHHGAPGFSTLAEPESSFGFLSSIFRVLVFDGRGSGASDHVGPYSNDRWVQDVENLRRWAGEDKFVLAGGSYGGAISLLYALSHGDRLLGLVLRDTFVNGTVCMLTAFANILTSERLKVDVTRQVRTWSGTLLDDKDFEEAVEEILPIYAPPKTTNASSSKEFEGVAIAPKRKVYNAAAQNAAFSVNIPRYDVRHQLKDIKVPTLVVVGRHDNVAPVEFSQEIANGIPNSRLEIFEHSGHSPPSDEPEKFRERVLDFIKTEIL